MKTAKRIDALPPYLFASLDRKKSEARAKGVDIIDFGVGDPDLPTPEHIVEAAAKAVRDPATHRYPSYYGMEEFRSAIADYYQRRYDVTLNPDTQVLPLIGSKEGLAHLPVAFVDSGDTVLVPDPAYPVYETATLLSGGRVSTFPLGSLPSEPEGAKILWLNYPNNPTAAICEADLFARAIDFCRDNDILLAHDAAYLEITFEGYVAPSLLQSPGALDVGIEFGSLSKTFNMTGWRMGWAAGAESAIEALSRVKTNIDSGIFNALQMAGIAALEGPRDAIEEAIAIYKRRRDALVAGLNSLGWDLEPPKGSIYLWVPTTNGRTSVEFTEFLLERAGIVVAPGSGYGRNGEGFVRFSLTIDDERLEVGIDRMKEALER